MRFHVGCLSSDQGRYGWGQRRSYSASTPQVVAVLKAATDRERSREELQTAAGIRDRDHFRRNYLEVMKNEEALRLFKDGTINLLGGTAWLWADPDFTDAVDVLFVDEAGQMPLANVLAAAQAAGSIVLLGDPQQLEQPKKGSHPEGVNASALQHILGEHQTIPSDRGIFLPVTWRLPPSICEFTSELFYERRLTSKQGLDRQQIAGGPFTGSGLWVLEVEHDGNRNASDEEVKAVADLVGKLTVPGSLWIDEYCVAKQMTGIEILVVSPYNAQVSRLAQRLKDTGVRVGTVDKFQGQQAPVVIYSMATSRPEEAPHGLEFLYSLNRLNVATSRAQCAVFLVASPRLFVPDCSTPRQMKLANALCRYRELAVVVPTNAPPA
jgi:superfamily I DNA and/or RNA helicase